MKNGLANSINMETVFWIVGGFVPGFVVMKIAMLIVDKAGKDES